MFQLRMAWNKFPLGMISLLENERWLDDHTRPAVFVWFLAAAPAEALSPLDTGQSVPQLLTSATLDIAVTVSLNGPAGGRLWLHADPGGGDTLFNWYLNLGLENVGVRTIVPSARLLGRENDGRYFRLTPTTAAGFSARFDRYRS